MMAPWSGAWRQHSEDRGGYRPPRYCEDCGAVIDGDPDSTLDRKFSGKPRTKCADDLIKGAAEELENG